MTGRGMQEPSIAKKPANSRGYHSPVKVPDGALARIVQLEAVPPHLRHLVPLALGVPAEDGAQRLSPAAACESGTSQARSALCTDILERLSSSSGLPPEVPNWGSSDPGLPVSGPTAQRKKPGTAGLFVKAKG